MIGGLFDNPNDLALHLVTMIPIALIFFFRSRNPVTKLISLAVAIVLLGGIVSTFSRGGFLGLMLAGLVFLWKLGKRMRWLIPPLALGAVLGFLIFAPGDYRTRLSTTRDDSAMARFDDLKRSVYVTLRHPIVGVGMDNYILFSNSNKATHNAYTQVSSEMGIAAAVVYILFLVTAVKRMWRIERAEVGNKKSRQFYYTAILLQASLVGYMVSSFFASVAFLWYIYYLVGYVVCTQRLYDSAKAKEVAKDAPDSRPAFSMN
jgi:putative inorganic carbon (HCO3(-)) transporter